MPGIFGFVSERPLPDSAGLARAMGSLLSSHGDQRSSAACGPNWGLGATWIPGQQRDPEPVASPDRRTWSVANGEVYPCGDAPEAPPAAPGPAIREALAAGDPGRLAQLNGQFAAAVIDPTKGTAEVVCDRYGLHQFFWVQRDGIFAFASELKALLAIPGVGSENRP